MPIQIQGFSGVLQEVENATRAARVTIRPIDVTGFGSYSIGLATGAMGAGTAEIMQFRWVAGGGALAIIRSVRVSVGGIGGFTAGQVTTDMFVARAWTAQGTGGTGITIGGNNNKRRTSFATSLVAAGDVRISTTVALGAGTRTADANAFASLTASTPATAGTPLIPPTFLYSRDTEGEYPLVFATQEGFYVRVITPATGTYTASVTVEWTELGAF